MLDKMNDDILNKIYQYAILCDKDETIAFEQEFCKINTLMAQEKQIFIKNYVTNLTQKQIGNIIAKYGNAKATTLYYSFRKIGLGDSDSTICEILGDCEKNNVDREIVELVFKDCVQFDHDWRDNDKWE
jgi:hypothetical protein